MKKLQEISISGAASYVYDILQKAIEIMMSKDATILEIGQSESTDKNGDMTIFLKMLYSHEHRLNIKT
jgi:hypothetical protein